MVNFWYWTFLKASFNFLLFCNSRSSLLIDSSLLFTSKDYILVFHNVKIIWKVKSTYLLICTRNFDFSTLHQIFNSWGALLDGFQNIITMKSIVTNTITSTKLVISFLILSLISSYFLFMLSISTKENGMWGYTSGFWCELSTTPRIYGSFSFKKLIRDFFEERQISKSTLLM